MFSLSLSRYISSSPSSFVSIFHRHPSSASRRRLPRRRHQQIRYTLSSLPDRRFSLCFSRNIFGALGFK
ncbi:hypothetical protein LguiB_018539 [Lonicera macranthoides]